MLGSHSQSEQRKAILLFARSPLTEAHSKHIAGLDFAERVQLFTGLTHHTISVASRSGFDIVLATDTSSHVFKGSGISSVLMQHGNGFGERLRNAVTDTFGLGYDQLAVIGNDSPVLDAAQLRDALLSHSEGGLGLFRASDGGVTLITLDRQTTYSLPQLFTATRWETGFVFNDLACHARSVGIPIHLCGEGHDIDSASDLKRVAISSDNLAFLTTLARSITHRTTSVRPFPAPYTFSLRKTLRTCRQKAPPLS